MDMLVLHVQAFVWTYIFNSMGVYLVEESLNHRETQYLAFGGTAMLLPEVSAPLYISLAGKGVLISPSTQQCFLSVFRIVVIPMGVN